VLEHLYKTMEEYSETHNIGFVEKVNYCGYQITNNGKYPFLQFLLYKNNILNEDSEQLTFISDTTSKYYKNNYIDASLLINYSENYLYKFLFFFNKDTIFS
jgi:hypothetical protein